MSFAVDPASAIPKWGRAGSATVEGEPVSPPGFKNKSEPVAAANMPAKIHGKNFPVFIVG
jgi:hypothetical protein